MLYSLIILSLASPVAVIASFIIGYNIGQPYESKKIKRHKAPEPTAEDKLLDYIDNFEG